MAVRFNSVKCGPMIRQPFRATCVKCRRTIYFDIDDGGTPGFNGDWGDGRGDYGCAIDNGDNSEDGNGHVPGKIVYDRKMYPKPKQEKKLVSA